MNFNSPKVWLAALVGVLLLGFTLYAWDARPAPEPHVVNGNAEYRAQRYRDALLEYESAPGAGPRNAGVQLDRGLARFRNALPPGDGGAMPVLGPDASAPEGVTHAQEELRTAGRGGTTNAGEDVDAFLRAAATYDLGNTWFAQRSWDNAIEAYKEALRLRPTWKDAAWNLELARRLREEDRRPPPDAGTPDASPPGDGGGDSASPDSGERGDAGSQENDSGNQSGDGGSNAQPDAGSQSNDGGGNRGNDGGAPPPQAQDAGAPPRSLAPLDDLDRSVRSLQNERLRVNGHPPRNPDDDR